MDASNSPVRRGREKLHTGNIDIHQKPVIATRDDLLDEVAPVPEDVLKADYLEALKFSEEPVTIRIERSSEKFAPRVIDLWCNGRGAEIILNGRWAVVQALPVGIPVTTKRKYVEILARSKVDSITTDSGKIDENSEKNLIERHTSSKAPFSVIRDDNPKGAAWLTSLVTFG